MAQGLAIWSPSDPRQVTDVSHFAFIWVNKMGIKTTDFVELLWELNELACVKLTAHTRNNTGFWHWLIAGHRKRFFTVSLSNNHVREVLPHLTDEEAYITYRRQQIFFIALYSFSLFNSSMLYMVLFVV